MATVIESTTDTPEQVKEAMGVKEEPKKKESVQESKEDETHAEKEAEESDDSANEDGEEESSTDEEQEHSKDEEKPKKKNGFKKRIDKLTRKLSEREREIEALRARVTPQGAEAKESATKKESVSSDRPKPDQFDTHAEYIEALTDWKLEAKEKEREDKEKKKSESVEEEKILKDFRSKVEKFKESVDDYDDYVQPILRDVTSKEWLSACIVSSDVSAELLYELGKNEDELERISKMSPAQGALALGRLEAKLLAKKESSETKEAKTSKAPPPLKPVGTQSAAKSNKEPSGDNYQEWKRWREKQMRR